MEVGNVRVPDTPMHEERFIPAATAESVSQKNALPSAVVGADVCDPGFDELYEAYFPLLRGVAMRKFGIPRDDVDELVQDVFATYLTHADRVRELRPYLIGGICNAARQYWRQADARKNVFCDADVCSAAVDDAVLGPLIQNTLISAALSRLGKSCRETLRRFYIDGESATSIAKSRATTQNSIHRLLNYCRGRARQAYRAMSEVI